MQHFFYIFDEKTVAKIGKTSIENKKEKKTHGKTIKGWESDLKSEFFFFNVTGTIFLKNYIILVSFEFDTFVCKNGSAFFVGYVSSNWNRAKKSALTVRASYCCCSKVSVRIHAESCKWKLYLG